jgi:YCII-related domain-containing protein
MPESEPNTVLDACFSYNDELRKNGKVAVTDGPYAETKEQLGGIQVLEARDLNHAIELIPHFPMSGSEVAVWNNRDTSSGGFERNDQGERAATAKGHLAMRAATRERMISIMARGLVQWSMIFWMPRCQKPNKK